MLIIRFMQGSYKPGKQELYNMIQEAKEITKSMRGCKFQFQHIPRKENARADFLGRYALDVLGEGFYYDKQYNDASKCDL